MTTQTSSKPSKPNLPPGLLADYSITYEDLKAHLSTIQNDSNTSAVELSREIVGRHIKDGGISVFKHFSFFCVSFGNIKLNSVSLHDMLKHLGHSKESSEKGLSSVIFVYCEIGNLSLEGAFYDSISIEKTVIQAISAMKLICHNQLSFNEVIVKGHVYLNGATIHHGLSCSGKSRFEDKFNIDGIVSGGGLFIVDSDFQKTASFSKMTLRKDISSFISGNTFREDVTLSSKTSLGKLSFSNNTVGGQAMFSNSIFDDGLDMKKSVFNGDLYISNSTIEGVANFEKTIFKNLAYFTDTSFNGVADFSNATFHENPNLYGTTFGERLFLRDTAFQNGINLEDAVLKSGLDSDGITGISKGVGFNNTSRRTFRMLKSEALQLNNVIEASRYHALEMDRYMKEVRNSFSNAKSKASPDDKGNASSRNLDLFKPQAIGTLIVLAVHKCTSNFATSWARPLGWIIVVGVVTYVLSGEVMLDGDNDDSCPQGVFLSIVDYMILFKRDAGIDNAAVYAFNKASLGFLYYQFVRAVRHKLR